jgi:hypothetical protein
MTRPDYRALLWGVGLLTASMLLFELLAFRLASAVFGHEMAMVVAFGHPALAALGAMFLGRRRPEMLGAQVLAGSAHLAAIAGATTVLGAVAVTWVSQKYALDRAGPWHLALALASFLLPGLFAGGAFGLALRRGVRFIGRLGFAEALGGVLGCALLPVALWVGAPRATLSSGVIFAAAALCLAWAGRRARPHWAAMATLPLAVIALVLGDVGEPWMDVRIDDGRRTKVNHVIWTDQGAIAADKIERGESRLRIDRNPPIPLPKRRTAGQKPRFETADLGYVVDGRADKGPALVIGSGATREVDVALAHGHSRVDALELHASLFEVMALEGYASLTSHLASGEVRLRVGDGRAPLRAFPGPYQRIVVLEASRFDQTAPRLLSRHDRLFTVQAFQAYLDRLRDDGTLLVRLPEGAIHGAMASAAAAVDEDPAKGRERLVACAGGGHAILVVGQLEPSHRSDLVKRCLKAKLDVVYPLEEPRRGSRDNQAALAERERQSQAIESAVAVGDDRPFLVAPPPPSGLDAAVVATARALVPTASSEPAPKDAAADKPSGVGPAGLAGLGVLVSLAAVLLGALVPAVRRRDPKVPPSSLRASFVFLGAALALCMFALGDRLLRVAGDATFAWSFIVPVGLVGIGSGRLWVDTLHAVRARRTVMMALAIALVWLLMLHVVSGRLEGLATRPEAVRFGLSGVLLVISGFLLGFPVAAGLRFVGEWERASVSPSWGMHHAGWALGGAAAALLVHYVGVARLWPLGVAVFAVGAVLMTIGARKAPPLRLPLRTR